MKINPKLKKSDLREIISALSFKAHFDWMDLPIPIESITYLNGNGKRFHALQIFNSVFMPVDLQELKQRIAEYEANHDY